ncbi:putative membrane protein [Acorus calamus]|uniref:Membrane protein n=1 Tax=Acorus calamus TaxID=4465 RepID=A0AAV9ENW8_ACOCL|nr:putative membrane protein [Acorus calamus]
MEPPEGFWATIWSFLCFLPFFIGLLLLGIVKGAFVFPFVCLIITVGNATVIIGLWPVHIVWTNYCIARAKQLGPVLKVAMCIGISGILILWPLVGILGSIVAGLGYGFLAPLVATFDAVGEGKDNKFIHCIWDGTWSTIKGSFTVVRDFTDTCFHSYFSVMDDLRLQEPPTGKKCEIRLLHLPGAFIVGLLGVMGDMPVITMVALYKSPYMLFKGWHRLFHDLIGREGPFLETACVPFAGLAILLWPSAVTGAVLASIISSFFLGSYAAIVAYQENSISMGLSYIIASMSIYDEYSNDVLDMPEGSCFPRPPYRKNVSLRATSFSRHTSFNHDKRDGKAPLSRNMSLKNAITELKPIKLFEQLFVECKHYGESLIAEGMITITDVNECKSGKGGGGVISTGLPAYCILQTVLRSVSANSEGLLLIDNTEITTMNRPRDVVFDWFFDPIMIIKEQIKVENFSEAEENYLCKLVLLIGDSKRLQSLNAGMNFENERRRAEIDAFARRLQGITKFMSRYPTYRRRFECMFDSLSADLAEKFNGSHSVNGSKLIGRSRSGLRRLFSQKSFGMRTSKHGGDREIQSDEVNAVESV